MIQAIKQYAEMETKESFKRRGLWVMTVMELAFGSPLYKNMKTPKPIIKPPLSGNTDYDNSRSKRMGIKIGPVKRTFRKERRDNVIKAYLAYTKEYAAFEKKNIDKSRWIANEPKSGFSTMLTIATPAQPNLAYLGWNAMGTIAPF